MVSEETFSFFHADHVGSLLRPSEVLEARKQWKNGSLDHKFLTEIEDKAIKDAVRLQEDVGLKVITDGEFRRENWWVDFIGQINGVEISQPDNASEFKTDGGKGSGYIPKVVNTISKISHSKTIMGRDYKILSESTLNVPKITIPSPTRIHFHGGRKAVDSGIYPDIDGFWSDVATFYQEEISSLEKLGCRYIQIDDPVLTYFLDDRMRQNLREIGEDPDILITRYADLLNNCIKNRNKSTHIAMHLCRGNALSSWIVEGGYQKLAPAIFPVVKFDTFFLEYDDERSGDFKPLEMIPNGTNVVLGLLTTKRGHLENRGDVIRQIELASKYVPIGNLALSPQCGFASVDVGNIISMEDQMAKLEMVVSIAEEVWGKL